MNKVRRGEIKKVIVLLNESLSKLNSVKNEEEFAYDSLPENFQDSERGELMQENIEALEEASDKIDEAKYLIEEAIELIEYL